MNEKEQAFAYIEGHRDAMMKMWEELVMMDSGSGNKPGVMPLWQKLPAFWKAWAAKPALLNTKMQAICW